MEKKINLLGALKGAGMDFPRWKFRARRRSRDAPGLWSHTTFCGTLGGWQRQPCSRGQGALAELSGSLQGSRISPSARFPWLTSRCLGRLWERNIPMGIMIHQERPLLCCRGWM